jgi:hypothetical protein
MFVGLNMIRSRIEYELYLLYFFTFSLSIHPVKLTWKMAETVKVTKSQRVKPSFERLELNKVDFRILSVSTYDIAFPKIPFAVYSPDQDELLKKHMMELRDVYETENPPDADDVNKCREDFIHTILDFISPKTPVYTKENGKQYAGVFETLFARMDFGYNYLYGAIQLPELATPELTDAERRRIYHREQQRISQMKTPLDYVYFWRDFPESDIHEADGFIMEPRGFYEVPFNPPTVCEDVVNYVREDGQYWKNDEEFEAGEEERGKRYAKQLGKENLRLFLGYHDWINGRRPVFAVLLKNVKIPWGTPEYIAEFENETAHTE